MGIVTQKIRVWYPLQRDTIKLQFTHLKMASELYGSPKNYWPELLTLPQTGKQAIEAAGKEILLQYRYPQV